MPEVTNNTPRLLAAAKEFNIGKETLIDFLANKGYDMGGFGSPNARLTSQMYAALQSEFQQDKANKRKSDQIALPKGSVLDAMKKKEKEEAEAAAKKKEAAPKEEPTPAAAVEAPKPEPKPEPRPEPKAEPKPEPKPELKPEPKPEPKPVPVAEEKPVVKTEEAPKEPVVTPQQPVAEKTPPPAQTQPETPEVVKTDAPRINGPKVIATIDLDALNKPKRPPTPPAQFKKPEQEEKPVVAKQPEQPIASEKDTVKEPAPQTPAQPQPVAQQQPPVEATKPAQPEAKPQQPVQPVQNVQPVQEEKTTAPAAEKPAVPAVEEKQAPAAEKSAAAQEKTKEPAEAKEQQPAHKPAAQHMDEVAADIASDQEDNGGAAVIENIQAEKLTGPKVIGKIELPVHSERRDNKGNSNFNRGGGNNNNADNNRKRKRIIVEKKPEPIQPGDLSKGGNTENRGPGNRGDFNRDNRQGGNRDNRDNRDNSNRPASGPSRPHTAPNRDGRPGGPGGNRPGGQQHGGGNRPGGGPGGNRPGGGQHGGGNRPGGNFGNRPGGQGNFNRDRDRKPEEKEIDKNEIQNKIKETMAKMTGGGNRGKNTKAKQRREKRHELAEQMANQGAESNKLQVTEFVSVSELANLMDVSFAEVISKCMGLGIMVSINQRLDAEVIELVAGEFGYEVEFIGVDDADEIEEEEITDNEEDLIPRAPIVTIMGHVDHGKTSLLDYIRNANVVSGEAGGITQHIGAYQVVTASGKKLTFLDTPGHEAFTAMRARGAKVADIAIIVIAADDAIMPQTREAISHSQAAGLPMVFAINKVDKDGANPEKIKEQLAGMNLLVEDWGGKYQSQEISAKSGLNIDILLEKILLEAELLELKANPNREASGSVIEASLDKGRGYVATVLVQSGTLHQGDTIASGSHFGKIKAMFNERGQRVDSVGPSSPVQVLGLNGAPQAGEKFRMFEDESEAKEVANRRAQIIREQGIRTKKHITLDEIGRRLALGNFKQLNLIIKGDFDGSVEALSDSLQKLSTEEIVVSVVHKAVGQITESDVLLATASDAIIVGFQVRPSSQASKLAEKENIEIRTYSIIYDAIDELKSAMEGMLEPKIEKKVVANVEIRETYRFDKVTVAGCFVLDGKITRNTRVNLVREGIVIYTGELASLKRYKDDVKEVAANMECGLSIRNYSDLKVGDIVEGFEEVEVKRTL